MHDGIDTASIRPRPDAEFGVSPSGKIFRAADEVITYINRCLEPMRGIHVFLRSLPAVLAARPAAHVLIVGSTDQSPYGKAPPDGKTWKDVFLEEVSNRIDTSRVHWLGRIGRSMLDIVLAVSRVHVYLTYPFVLSWSLLEAMSAGCLVVASGTEPVQEVIEHGRNGLLVDFFDHQTLAKTVIDALSEPCDSFSKMRAAARETVIKSTIGTRFASRA